MADIDQILAGGAGASSRADFSGLAGLLDSYYKGRDQSYQQEGRDLFKGGVPTTPDGQPDFAAMGKALFQHGDVGQGTALSNLDLQRQQLLQGQNDARFMATGRNPPPAANDASSSPSIVRPPSTASNGSAPIAVAPALNNGGSVNGGQPSAPQQPTTLMGYVAAAGIPNDQLGAVSASIGRQLGIDPQAQINPQDPQFRNVVVPAIQQYRRMGVGQVVQGGLPGQPAQPQQAPPQGQPQVQPVAQMTPQQAQQAPQAPPQAQPSPYANAVASGLIPPGVDPNMYVARLNYIAAASQNPAAQKAAKDRVDAITKASELTSEQRDYNAAHANPDLNEFTTQKEADKALATGIAASNVKEQDSIIADGRAGQKRLTTLNAIVGIVNADPNISLGFGADTGLKVRMALESLGVPKSLIGDLSGPQAIQKLNAALAAESTKGITARPSQFEFKTFLANNPGLSLDRDGLLRVAGITAQLAKRDYDLGQKVNENRYDWGKWNGIVKQYDKDNPIKDPTTGRVITTDSVIAPGPSRAAPSKSADPHPEGSIAINPQTKEQLKKVNGRWVPFT